MEIKDWEEEYKILGRICQQSVGLSGRALRKIPFIAHALFLNSSYIMLKDFLEAMEKAIEKEKTERSYFKALKEEL